MRLLIKRLTMYRVMRMIHSIENIHRIQTDAGVAQRGSPCFFMFGQGGILLYEGISEKCTFYTAIWNPTDF